MKLQISEIFYSIQGESTHAGRPCVFVRLTGCPLRCTWCDTEWAFHGGEPRTISEILAEVASHGCNLVEVTGGEPLAQKHCVALLQALLDAGHEVLLETSGALPIEDVPAGVKRIVDLKAPGSGEEARNRWENLNALRPGDELKFVIADRADYEWALHVIEERELADKLPIHFSPVHDRLEPAELAEWMKADRAPARLQIQLHKHLWPGVEKGV